MLNRRPAVLTGARSIPLLEASVGQMLREIAQQFPTRPALLWAAGDRIETLNYAVLLDQAEQVAHWILQRASPGDRIAIWSCNSVEWIVLEYGCALAGCIVTAWNTAWTDTECTHARELGDPKLIFAGADVRGVDLLARAKTLSDNRETHDLRALLSLAAGAPPTALPVIAPDDLFLLQFTSGTTGRPKAAILSHRASVNAAWIRVRLYGGDETDVWLNPVPMTHVGGAIAMVLGAMLTGAAYVVMPRFSAAAYNHLTIAGQATRIGGVPTMLIAALEHPDWQPTSFIRSIGLGGTQVPPTLVERVRSAFGAPIVVAYGQSECPIITSSLPEDDQTIVHDTTGRASPHVELKICAPGSSAPLAIGDIGEILVRSPVNMNGYYKMPEATAATIEPDGFLRTGDLGSVDEHGYLRVHGRARDVIIRGGENIYPAEVEEILLQHPDIASVCVVGIPDERYGQQVAAAIVLRPDRSVTTQALTAFAATHLAHFKIPRQWRFEPSLPVTASGKIRKIDVEKTFSSAFSPL